MKKRNNNGPDIISKYSIEAVLMYARSGPSNEGGAASGMLSKKSEILAPGMLWPLKWRRAQMASSSAEDVKLW